MTKEEKAKEKLDFMYEVVSKKFERQNDDLKGIVSKASFLLAFSGAFFTAFLGLVVGGKIDAWVNIPCFILIFSTLFCTVMVVTPRTFDDPPPVDEFYTNANLTKTMDIVQLKNRTIASIAASYKDNATTLNEIVDWFKLSLWLLFATFVTIVIVNISNYGKVETGTTSTPAVTLYGDIHSCKRSPDAFGQYQEKRRGFGSCSTFPRQWR